MYRRRFALPGAMAAVLFIAVPLPAAAQTMPAMYQPGEELTYNVRFSFIDLGQIKITTVREVSGGGYRGVLTTANIASYKSIPFVSAQAVFESVVDSGSFSRSFLGRSREGDDWSFSRYTFLYDRGIGLLEIGTNDTVVARRDTLALTTKVQDGLSLFYFAREHLFAGTPLTVPTIIREKKAQTTIDFRTERESVEIDAVEYPIDTQHFVGNADFVGFYGLTGSFEGWFSNDAARVPIMAKMQVFIGNVTIELIKWKRSGWTPPQAKG
jgi:hypothetical protein